LQVTSNDFINNDWNLESRSYFNNNLRSRPYWENGQVAYRFPSTSRLVQWTDTHLRLAYFLHAQMARILAHFSSTTGLPQSIEQPIWRGGPDTPELKTSASITAALLARMKRQAPLVVFMGDQNEANSPYATLWRRICRQQEIPFLADVPQAVKDEERRLGVSIRPDGAHWDARGHAVVGQNLAVWLK